MAGTKFKNRTIPTTVPNDPAAEGLALGPIKWVSPRALKDHPENGIFDALKSAEYWKFLKRDISDAGQILEPLLITHDDTIISGHSRRTVALDLLDDGDKRFAEIPVRQILVPMDKNEEKRRVYLANLSRFQIDQAAWLHMVAEIYPEYFTGAASTDDKPSAPVKQIAQEMGKSERHIKRGKRTITRANEIAKKEGVPRSPKHVAKAKEEENNKRRASSKKGHDVPTSKTEQPATDTGETEITLDSANDAPDRVMIAGDALTIDNTVALTFRDLTALTDEAAFREEVYRLIQRYVGGDL